MIDLQNLELPKSLKSIEDETQAIGFGFASDRLTGSLLRTLASSKPRGRFLEIGTGTGLSASWILDGMDLAGKLLTVDKDPEVVKVAKKYLGNDSRVEFNVMDGAAYLK